VRVGKIGQHRFAICMDSPDLTPIHIGDWIVHPATGQIVRGSESLRLEARALRLLLCLAERAPQVVSIDELLSRVWPDVTVSPDSVYQVVATLRRQLGDDSRQPTYIATVPRLGYQMLAAVTSEPAVLPPVAAASAPSPSRFRFAWLVPVLLLCIALVSAIILQGRISRRAPAATPVIPALLQPSIAVLPFLDLTPGMQEEEFADGMTEELIDKLAQVPGLHVPPPTSSFVYKGKQIPIAQIARALGVVYILDGSVRKDSTRIRVATRLVRADSGYVLWSATYDRPFKDILVIQDDIASSATRALAPSLAPSHATAAPQH